MKTNKCKKCGRSIDEEYELCYGCEMKEGVAKAHKGIDEMHWKERERREKARALAALESMKKYKLAIELVPSTCWYSNLRNSVSRETWDVIRNKAYEDASYTCPMCGFKGKLNCHERWEYDDENHLQKLVGFIALCDTCHDIKHIGLAGIKANEGRLDYNALIKHFMKVNNCSKKEFLAHRGDAFGVWEWRSCYEWECDLGEYAELTGMIDRVIDEGK